MGPAGPSGAPGAFSIPLVYAGADNFINFGPGTGDADTTSARFPVPTAVNFFYLYLFVTTATLPAGPFQIDLYINNVNIATIGIVTPGSSGLQGLIGPIPHACVVGDLVQLKCTPSGGGGSGTLAISGTLWMTP